VRLAVVTGSSSGIGRATALRLERDGWRVIGLDRAPSPDARETRIVDLADRAALAREAADIAAAAPAAFVHCAGVLRTAALGRLALGDGEAMWRVHVEAAAAIADALAPAMPDGGRIVLVGSRAADGIGGRSLYGASKAALAALARAWGAELIARGITVNVVAPAATDTPMLTDPARGPSPPVAPPLGRFVRAEEVAAAIAFLLSPDAAAITGQTLTICGGASLSGCAPA
jgi:NAD(P)-dependent dehydrogenase (short-subunit alcohol dehydrogenase family)